VLVRATGTVSVGVLWSGTLARVGATDGLGGLIQRWAEWVTELAEHPLDQHEYLGPLEHRDAIAEWLEVHGRAGASDAVGEADADFQALTVEDSRYAVHFAAQAGPGWWWQRMPSDPVALDYLTQDW